MPKAGPPPWRQRSGPFLDKEVQASVAAGAPHPPGGHSGSGWKYAELTYAGCDSRDRAEEIKRALYRAAARTGVSMTHKIVKAPDGTYSVRFAAACKECARLWVVRTYGPDRQAWPYNPMARSKQE
jgi:hypothetical protein